MEGGMTGQDYDELEMLLGEIPNATSVGHHAGHHNPRVSEEVDPIIQSNRIHGYQVPEIGVECESDNCNLLDDKLALAFKDVKIKENVATRPSIHTFFLNDWNPKNIEKLQSGFDDLEMCETLNGIRLSSIDMEAQSLNLKNIEFFKQNERYDGHEPMQTLERLPDKLSDHQLVVPMSTTSNSYEHYYFADGDSPAYFSRNNFAQPGMEWNDVEEEMYSRLHRKYIYAQHFENKKPELRKCMNSMYPCFDLSLSPHFDKCNADPYWNANAYPCESSGRVENLYSHGHRLQCPKMDFRGSQVFNEAGKPSSPEKILTRFHGVNPLIILRPNPLASDQPLFFGQSRLMRNRSLQMDNLGFRGSSANNLNSRLTSRSMQKNCNSVDELIGRIYFIAKDQDGCRFLQKKLREGFREDIDKIFTEIIGHIVELMTDPFGNYLVQKLVEVCNEEQMKCILKLLTRKEGELIIISCDIHGTRSVQKVIETLRNDEQITTVILSLKHGIVTLMKDINGNHVAQQFLKRRPEYCEFLFDAAIAHCFELATDRQGCCVLQKCMLHPERDGKRRLMSEIISYSLALSQDPYGNYVVQFLLEQKVPWASSLILKQLKGNYEHLSMQKYSSNVVEKCIKLSREEDRLEIIQELILSPRLAQALHDRFGNYVIQSALKESKGDLHEALVEAIRPHFSSLKGSPYGKKVLSRASLFPKN